MNNLIWVLRCLIQSLLFWSIIKGHSEKSSTPLIVSTWANADFVNAAQTGTFSRKFQKKSPNILKYLKKGLAWNSLIASKGQRRLQALVDGLSKCESLQCDRTVGYGGSPDERGETTLDALLIDGPAHRVGAVAALRRVKNAAQVAWAVMNYTTHTLLVGEKGSYLFFRLKKNRQLINSTRLKPRNSLSKWIFTKSIWAPPSPNKCTKTG